MNIKDLLTEKGFSEGVDYTLDGTVVTRVEKNRMVPKIINHPEVPEVKDDQGNIITPGKPAWDETIQVEEKYTEAVPSSDDLMRECLQRIDAGEIINDYIKTFTRPDGDLNIDLFLSGGDGWRIKNIPVPTISELYGMIEPLKVKTKAEKDEKERLKKLKNDAKKIVKDFDLTKVKKIEDILPMLTSIRDLLTDIINQAD